MGICAGSCPYSRFLISTQCPAAQSQGPRKPTCLRPSLALSPHSFLSTRLRAIPTLKCILFLLMLLAMSVGMAGGLQRRRKERTHDDPIFKSRCLALRDLQAGPSTIPTSIIKSLNVTMSVVGPREGALVSRHKTRFSSNGYPRLNPSLALAPLQGPLLYLLP